MDVIEIFQVLGIEQTKDERAIKNAYREKLAVTNPEDNPEGFKRLRAAYEEACVYARQAEDEGTTEERDDSPAGLWVQKAAALYGNIHTRCDVKLWEELFDEDIFLSLEEEENCRLLLLRFMMEHFKFPTDIWKLLDEKMHIVADARKLREKFPADFIGYMVNKCERGEDVEFTQFEGAPDANYDLFLQYYDRCWQAVNEDSLEQAAEYIQNADDLHIFHPVIEVCRATLYEKQGKLEDALTVMKELQQRFPEDVMIGYNAGELLWKNDRKEEAAVIYECLREANKKHYMANVRLTEWYYECGRYEESKKCAEEVLSSGADDEFMDLLAKVNHELEKDMEERYRKEQDWRTGLDLCWCYLQDGRVNKGTRLAVELEKRIPEDKQAEYNGLLAKLFVEGAEYEDSITMCEIWEKSLMDKLAGDDEEEAEKDRDRIRQSHVIRMQCHRSLGYADKAHFAEAIREAESVQTGTSRDIGLLLEMAQIYMEMEEYERSVELTRKLIDDYQVYAAYATSMEVYRRQWDAQGVVQCGRQCIQIFPNYTRAYEHVAKVYLDLKHTDDLKELLAEAEKNGIKSVMLDAYRYQMEHEVPSTEELDKKIEAFRTEYLVKVENGQLAYYEKGLPVLTEYLYWYPGTYMLVERGIFHKAAKHLQEAREDFEKALAENPAQPYALNGLSFVYKFEGDYDKALICMKKAILYLGEDLTAIRYADLANLYSLLGDYQRAVAAYQQFADMAGDAGKRSVYHVRQMALCFARNHQVEDAIGLLEEAVASNLIRYDEQVNIYQIAGNVQEAKALLEKWNKELLNSKKSLRNSDYADYYNRMAWQELMYGSAAGALDYFERLIKVKAHDNSISGAMCDMIFACILCGDTERGKLYSAKLRQWMQKEKAEGRNDYHDSEKGRLQLEFLSEFYKSDIIGLEAILDSEKECQICHHCSFCVCKEMEAVRILHMLSKGEREATMARLEKNLEIQPLDEYMIAIRHVCETCEQVIPANAVRKAADEPLREAGKQDKGVTGNASIRENEGTKQGFFGKLAGLFGKNAKK